MITLKILKSLSFIKSPAAAYQGGNNFTYNHKTLGLFTAHSNKDGILNVNSAITLLKVHFHFLGRAFVPFNFQG